MVSPFQLDPLGTIQNLNLHLHEQIFEVPLFSWSENQDIVVLYDEW